MTVVASHRFEISAITADIAGEQAFTLDAHITTRGNTKKVQDVLTVTFGGIVFYCHDGDSVRAFADAWATVLEDAASVLPEVVDHCGGPGLDRHQVGVILRVAGTQRRHVNVIPSGASPTGTPYARVGMGRLVVHAYDLAAVRSWADGWATAEHTANRIWPNPDAFDAAEKADRTRIARTGHRPSRPCRQGAQAVTAAAGCGRVTRSSTARRSGPVIHRSAHTAGGSGSVAVRIAVMYETHDGDTGHVLARYDTIAEAIADAERLADLIEAQLIANGEGHRDFWIRLPIYDADGAYVAASSYGLASRPARKPGASP